MKVSELSGALLDYWVAQGEGHSVRLVDDAVVFYTGGDDTGFKERRGAQYSPSTEWADGGPIIERERITIAWQPMKGEWMAGLIETENGSMLEFRWLGFNESPLVAAMRAYIASEFGAEVPDGRPE